MSLIVENQPALLTLAEAARLLGTAKRTLRKMIAAGEFPKPVRRNHRWVRVPVEDIYSYIDRIKEAR